MFGYFFCCWEKKTIVSVAQEPKHHIQWKWGTIRASQTASGQLSTHSDNIQGYLTMSESPSSTLVPRWDGLKQPLDLTDSNSRALDLTDTNSRPFAARKMRRPSCPLWIHTGWYATPDTTVLKAQLVVVILGDCPGLYKKDRQTEEGGGVQMCDITSHFCLASLFVAALSLCVFVSLYDMHEYSNSSTRLSRGQNGSKRHRRRRHTKTSMGIWLWAMHN